MFEGSTRRALLVTALFVVAGCSGAGTASPTASMGTYVHAGAPVAHAFPGVQRLPLGAVRPAHVGYPTGGSLVFEADQSEAAVNVYKTSKLAGNPSPIATIHVSTGCPYGMAMDKKGTLYVVDNCGGSDVEEYPKGSTTESTAITDGISNPLGAAIDKNGTLYVSNYPAAIEEYAFGTTTPSQTISGQGLTDPFGLALDKKGNLYIADFGASQVFEVPYGSTTVTALDLQDLTEPLGVAIDQKTGYLWVTDGSGDRVDVYQLGNTTPIEQITTGYQYPYAIALQNKGKPNGEVVVSDIDQKFVYAYKPGQYTSYATLTDGIALPTGLLVAKP